MSINLRFIVSKKIKKLRIKRSLTQEELAEKAGVDYKYLQKIEGKNPPNISLKTIEKIAKTLHVNPSKFLEN